MLGVLVFSFFSQPIFSAWRWIVGQIKKIFKKKERFSEPKADVEGHVEIKYEYIAKSYKPKLFTPSNRKLVKFWQKYGLIGIAFITPIVLSIPIGTVIASSLAQNRKKVLVYMFFSILFWSVFMTSMFEIFHASSVRELQNHIQNE